jgi:hypothetical protein
MYNSFFLFSDILFPIGKSPPPPPDRFAVRAKPFFLYPDIS